MEDLAITPSNVAFLAPEGWPMLLFFNSADGLKYGME
jgi:hypothetical protein